MLSGFSVRVRVRVGVGVGVRASVRVRPMGPGAQGSYSGDIYL